MAAPNGEFFEDLERLYDELYDKYGKPLEASHRGEYVAISPLGKTVVGKTLLDIAQQATATFGPGNYLFKIGEPAVGKWR